MKSSSSVTSTSVTSVTELLSSSSSSPCHPCFSLQNPEFLREHRSKFQSHSDFSELSVSPGASPSPPPSPFSPTHSSSHWSSSSSSSSPCGDSRPVRLSLSSPELLSELKELRTRPLRHVPAHNGLTTVFSGRGGLRASGPAHSTQQTNQKTSP